MDDRFRVRKLRGSVFAALDSSLKFQIKSFLAHKPSSLDTLETLLCSDFVTLDISEPGFAHHSLRTGEKDMNKFNKIQLGYMSMILTSVRFSNVNIFSGIRSWTTSPRRASCKEVIASKFLIDNFFNFTMFLVTIFNI